MKAAFEGHFECVEILAPLENRMKTDEGLTALMVAANKGYLECVKILAPLENGMKNK